MRQFKSGFSLVELLAVLAVVAVLAGFLFPIGDKFCQKARSLSQKVDGMRYQSAFVEFFRHHHHHPSCFPKDEWFNLASFFGVFVDTFSGQIRTYDNPEKIEFCELNAQEVATRKIADIYFFLRDKTNVSEAVERMPKTMQIYGSRVMFYIID